MHTNYKEVLRCKSGETVSRRSVVYKSMRCANCQFIAVLFNFDCSCDRVAWIDERNYWTFEAILIIVAILSTSVSFLRQRSLDRKVMLKVQRQLEQSV